jgi:hypothetical protein
VSLPRTVASALIEFLELSLAGVLVGESFTAKAQSLRNGLLVAMKLQGGPLGEPAPIPMLLWCPKCGGRHIDKGEFATKPHHTHACQHEGCGLPWRPAIVPTVGVEFLPGFKDTAT